jgi:hypothetical protein
MNQSQYTTLLEVLAVSPDPYKIPLVYAHTAGLSAQRGDQTRKG